MNLPLTCRVRGSRVAVTIEDLEYSPIIGVCSNLRCFSNLQPHQAARIKAIINSAKPVPFAARLGGPDALLLFTFSANFVQSGSEPPARPLSRQTSSKRFIHLTSSSPNAPT